MKILCGTDFSETAIRAGRIAARLARQMGDSLVLANVVDPPSTMYPLVVLDSRVLERAVREDAERRLTDQARDLRSMGVEVEERIVSGRPDTALATFAKEANARLIVVGTHGHRAAARALLGTVADRTAQHADRPVLVVRDAGDGFDDWVQGSRALKVMVGVDASSATDAAVAWARTLRQAGPCDVTFFHAYWPPGEYARLGLVGSRELLDPDPDVIRVLDRDLGERVGDLPGKGRLELRIRPSWGSSAARLADEARDARADLLIVGTHQRHGSARLWAGSVAQRVVHEASVPVLCVPTAALPAEAPSRKPLPRILTVLAPTDFSELGNAAVPYAYALLRATGGVVELCHVHERHLPAAYESDRGEDRLKPDQRAAIEARLRALVPDDAETYGITTHVSVVEASTPAEGITHAAERLGVDAVSLGSHGRSGLGRALLGSVANDVVRGATRPVLVVRIPAR